MSTVAPNKSTLYFKELDGLRFFAFFAVFLAHSFYSENPGITASPIYTTAREIGHLGIFGVNFFFVLSGFLITYLLLTEKYKVGKVRLGYFYLRRVLRIWPLYFLILLVGFWLVPTVQHLLGNPEYRETALLWPFLLFINNFFEAPQTAILGVLWSIAIEEQFYAFWPLVIRFLNAKLTLIFTVGVIVASALLRTFVIGWGYDHSLSCMSDLAIGALLAWLCYFYPQQRDRIASRIKTWQIVVVYVAGFLLFAFRPALAGITLYYLNERIIYSLFFAFVIFEQCFSPNSFFSTANKRFLVRSGVISYGLYMLHFTAIYVTLKVMEALHFADQLWQVMLFAPIVSFGFSYGLAILSYRFFETPFLKLKKMFSVVVKGS
ncbi:MAG TPA: acyltransferase [Cytophagales bacterium]|nr:acyltransferase [Cytophagales bacterium]HAA18635.1 acyltransferase [Cytophagales bacterium]HAP64575.1 acyltransferase [Cytophagales bacterium]